LFSQIFVFLIFHIVDSMKETPEETQARRAKEILIEESEETKRAREQIRLALGSPMG
jgi:hypothetical protein